jgi:hypothetical protein
MHRNGFQKPGTPAIGIKSSNQVWDHVTHAGTKPAIAFRHVRIRGTHR